MWCRAVNMDKDSWRTLWHYCEKWVQNDTCLFSMPGFTKDKKRVLLMQRMNMENSWPFSALGQLHQRILVQTKVLSWKRWMLNIHSHPSHKIHLLHTAIKKKEVGDEEESEEEMTHTWCTHHFPPKKHPRTSKNEKEWRQKANLWLSPHLSK